MQDKLNKISNKTTTKYKHLQPRIYNTLNVHTPVLT